MRLDKFLSVLGFIDDPRRDVVIEFATEADEMEVTAFVISADFRVVTLLMREKPEKDDNAQSPWAGPRVESEPPF